MEAASLRIKIFWRDKNWTNKEGGGR